jgi:hypothetical protein
MDKEKYLNFKSGLDEVRSNINICEPEYYKSFGIPEPEQYRAFDEYYKLFHNAPEAFFEKHKKVVYMFTDEIKSTPSLKLLKSVKNFKQVESVDIGCGSFWHDYPIVKGKIVENLNRISKNGVPINIATQASPHELYVLSDKIQKKDNTEIKQRIKIHYINIWFKNNTVKSLIEFPHTEVIHVRLSMVITPEEFKAQNVDIDTLRTFYNNLIQNAEH